jgi:iron complex transport system substrate-binding protein
MNAALADLRQAPQFAKAPQRIVSLVPSLTESLFDLGAGDRLVGITDYCRPPQTDEDRLVRIGGTRAPEVDTILRLQPDLILANQEENGRKQVEMLVEAGLTVWLTFPRTVDQALGVLREMVNLLRIPEAVARLDSLQKSLDWTAGASSPAKQRRVFCPIWQDEHPQAGVWWMTFNQDTYCHDLLARCGGQNVFADRERRIPLEADLGLSEAETAHEQDVRYPRVTPQEVKRAAPEVILLPSEPYAFGDSDAKDIADMLAGTPAVRTGQVHRIDGSLITWHGTRLALALAELPAILQGPSKSPG